MFVALSRFSIRFLHVMPDSLLVEQKSLLLNSYRKQLIPLNKNTKRQYEKIVATFKHSCAYAAWL